MHCYSCEKELPDDRFYHGNRRTCKTCIRERAKLRKENKENNIETPKQRPKEYLKQDKDVNFIGPLEPRGAKTKRRLEAWYEKNPGKKRSYYENSQEDKKKDRENNPKKYVLIRAKSRAKEKGLDFNLTEEDITIPTHCPILGIELVPNSPERKCSISIDRIDPSIGYVKGNVWIISGQANVMKNNADLETLVKFGKWAASLYALTLESATANMDEIPKFSLQNQV